MKTKRTVGIITFPVKDDGMLAALGKSWYYKRHAQWMRELGIEVLSIPYDTTDFAYYVQRINGLFLTSSYLGSDLDDKKEHTTLECVKQFIQLAIQENDNGNYFPIYGVCMGMQQMMITIAGDDRLLEDFDSYGHTRPLVLLQKGRLGESITDLQIEKMSKIRKFHHHKQGVSPAKFYANKSLTDFFDVLSIDKDKRGSEFVSTIEAKQYPFYGFQWHPENSAFTSGVFGRFFRNELTKNPTTVKTNTRKMRYKDKRCFRHTMGVYRECRFFF